MSEHKFKPLLIGLYQHFKGGEYEVIGLAKHTETGERLVVYRCLYGDYDLWVRPQAMFEESVELSGESIPRFTYLGPMEIVSNVGDKPV